VNLFEDAELKSKLTHCSKSLKTNGHAGYHKEKLQLEEKRLKQAGVAPWAFGDGSYEHKKSLAWYEKPKSFHNDTGIGSIGEKKRGASLDPMGDILKGCSSVEQIESKAYSGCGGLSRYPVVIGSSNSSGGSTCGNNNNSSSSTSGGGSGSTSNMSGGILSRKYEELSDTISKSDTKTRESNSKKTRNEKKSKSKSSRSKSKHKSKSEAASEYQSKVHKITQRQSNNTVSKDNTSTDTIVNNSTIMEQMRVKRLEREKSESRRSLMLLAQQDMYG